MPTPDAPLAASPGRRSGWWTRRALALHVTLLVVVPVFAALFWWQVERVRQGNSLSWAYVFEWPIFTGYAIYLWWRLVHDQFDGEDPLERGGPVTGPGFPASREPVGGAQGSAQPSLGGPAAADPDPAAEELAAYNRYLAELNASGRRKRW